MKHRIAFAAIVGLIALSVLPPALAGKAKRPAPGREKVVFDPDEAFVAAREAFVKNDPQRFEALAAQARDHPLADYLEFWRLRLRIQPPNPDANSGAADTKIRSFLERHEGTIVADILRRDWMRDLARRSAWAAFDGEYAKWVLRDDDEVKCYAALGHVQRGQPAPEARPLLFSVRALPEGCEALLDAEVLDGSFTREDLFERLLVALEVNAPEAIRIVGEHLQLDPAALKLALARPGQALDRKPSREIALVAISRLARDDPGKAAALLAANRVALDDSDRAFAWSQVAAAGMRRLDPQSLEWARAGVQAPATDLTWGWLARAALRDHDWTMLRTFIGRMSAEGRSDPTWVYWLARALREDGETTAGDVLLQSVAGQFTFYGQLAAEDLGQLTMPPPRARAPTEEELARVEANQGFERALRFYQLGLRLEGNREWNFQLRGMNDRQLLAAALWACEKQILDRCVNTAERTKTQHDFTLRFVSPFLDRMKPIAAQRDLDPAWIYGLIRQESRFLMDAHSWAGAQGLMQIMPNTARWIARKLGERDFRLDKLNDLDTNLRFGTFYLRTVLDDLEGSPVLASAAYNAGPRRPRNWRATLTAPVEGAIFTEIIPFNETRDYVKKVLTNSVFYSALFTGRPQSLKKRLGRILPEPDRLTDIP